ncbi:MAG: mercury resistance system transport protein MerF [Pseudomonas marincola]
MDNKKLFKIGIVGTIITAICCFTPLLVVIFSTLGISSLIGLTDFVLLPALVLFIVLTLFSFRKKAIG